MFSGASSTNVHGGDISSSQRDQNRATFIINVGGSDSKTSCTSSAVSKTSISGSVGDSPHVSTPSASDQEQNLMPEGSSMCNDSGLGSSDASFEIEQGEATVAIGSIIYKHHMLLKKHGMPLYAPQPLKRHPISYQRQGVSIGDVGVFTQFGDFDRLFNICLPAGHSSNPEVLPEGFYPLTLTPGDLNQLDYRHDWDSYITSPFVRRTGTTFQCSEPEGAILTMPQGAYHEDLVNVSKFRTYLNLHLPSWYDYANIVQGREIDNGNVHLVIGCDKTSLWGIATYSHRQSKCVEGNVTHLSFNRDEGRDSVYRKYVWEVDGLAEDLKVGPAEVDLLDPPEHHAIRPLLNQCTFIRSLNTALGANEWKQHELKVATAVAEARAPARLTRWNTLASILAATSSLPSRLGSLMGHSNSMPPAQALVADHPSIPILEMLLQKCPKAKVVVVNDSDWCSVIRDSDKDWIATAQDLPRRIQESFDIVEEENGAVYLQEKMRSSEQPNTPSQVSVESEDESLGDSLLASPSSGCLPCVPLPPQLDFKLTDGSLTIHPLLGLPPTGRTPFNFDVTQDPACTPELTSSSVLTPAVLAEAATTPPIDRMVLTCKDYPWQLNICPSKKAFVTVADVLSGIYASLQTQITTWEFNAEPQESQDIIAKAFFHRYKRLGETEEGKTEMARGMKRVDFLAGKHAFVGLCPTDTPLLWELILSPV